jgi:formylglycine-generating enzyme required for sulfatase activity
MIMRRWGLALAALVMAGLMPTVGWAGDSVTPNAVFQDCSTCPKMVVVPKGSFVMGQDQGAGSWEYPAELPRHTVTISEVFAVGVYPVTQAEFLAIMGYNPSYFAGNLQRPVETVTWDDAVSFIMKLSAKTGKAYRLPSEAEWEYVARAGHQTPWFFSAATAYPNNVCTDIPINQYAWTYCNATDGKAHPVGKLKPNPFGLYDIYGNVWEWVADCYNSSYLHAPVNGTAWINSSGCSRVLRGGSWNSLPNYTRSAYRSYDDPSSTFINYGFRVARTITP